MSEQPLVLGQAEETATAEIRDHDDEETEPIVGCSFSGHPACREDSEESGEEEEVTVDELGLVFYAWVSGPTSDGAGYHPGAGGFSAAPKGVRRPARKRSDEQDLETELVGIRCDIRRRRAATTALGVATTPRRLAVAGDGVVLSLPSLRKEGEDVQFKVGLVI